MRILPSCRGALLCFLLSLVLAASFCYADDKTVEVVGIGECAGCAENNFEVKQAFSGLRVTIDCKAADGHFKRRGSGELDGEGKFKVSIPKDLLKKEGELKEECYAQLHSSSSGPCPSHDGLESSKIVSQSKTNEKHIFGLRSNLKFSPVTCASEFYWHHYHKHPFFHAPEEPKPKPKPNPKPKPEPKPKPQPKPQPKPEPKPMPHPFYKHPLFKHPYFKNLPPFPKIPPHHP